MHRKAWTLESTRTNFVRKVPALKCFQEPSPSLAAGRVCGPTSHEVHDGE